MQGRYSQARAAEVAPTVPIGTLVEDLQSRLIMPCAKFVPEDQQAIPDIPSMLLRLLLFETYILQTIRFKEFVPLVRILGIDNVVCLLDSGALKLELDPTMIFQSGQTKDFPAIREKPPLPLMSFSCSVMRGAEYNDYLVRNLEDIHHELYGYISSSDLESAILRSLLPRPEMSGLSALKAHEMDLRANSPIFKKALLMKLRRERGMAVAESDLDLKIITIDDTDYKVESNLDRLGLNVEEAHAIIEQALLAVGNLNSRIEDMKNYNALSGFIDGEVSLFAGRFDFLESTLSPARPERTFERVVKIRQLPSFEVAPPDRSFNMGRFIEARASKECIQFRAWLRHMQTATDAEIAEQINGVRVKLAPFVHGTIGKSLRLAISTAIGIIPPFGSIIGPGLSAVDLFLFEKIFPISGPILFLTRSYPSLFDKKHLS